MSPNHFEAVHMETMGRAEIGPITRCRDAAVVTASSPRCPHRPGLPRVTCWMGGPGVLLWSASLAPVRRWLGALFMLLTMSCWPGVFLVLLLALLRPDGNSYRKREDQPYGADHFGWFHNSFASLRICQPVMPESGSSASSAAALHNSVPSRKATDRKGGGLRYQ
jgi:hypothetical protein